MARFNTVEHMQDGRFCMSECSFWGFISRIRKPQYEGFIEFKWGSIRIEKPDPYMEPFWDDINQSEQLPF